MALVASACAACEAGHTRHVQALERRLAAIGSVRKTWAQNDVAAFAVSLANLRDDAVLAGVFRRLEQASGPVTLAPRPLARLLALAQSLALKNNHEDHAVNAMRFILHALRVSWPPVARALRNVATHRSTREECEEVRDQFSSCFAEVKKLSRSVRLQRSSNGPLVPTCRKLKAALEEALTAVGRPAR